MLSSEEYKLFKAIANNDINEVRRLLNEGVNINVKNDHSGSTPLHFACLNNQLDIADYLLKCGAKVNAVNNRGQTPAHFATYGGHLELLQHLILKWKADPSLLDNKSKDCLLHAMENDHYSIIKWLITNKLFSLAHPILFSATVFNKVEIIQFLIEHGENITTEYQNNTLLHWLCLVTPNLSILTYLINHPKIDEIINKPNSNSRYPLQMAYVKTHLCFLVLIDELPSDHGIKFQELTRVIQLEGYSAYVRSKNQLAFVDTIANTCTVLEIDQENLAKFDQRMNVPALLTQEDKSVHITLADLDFIFSISGHRKKTNFDLIKVLLMKADPNIVFPNNLNLLQNACKDSEVELIQWLIRDKNLDMNQSSCNRTPLSTALEYKRKEVVETLLKMGAGIKFNLMHYELPKELDLSGCVIIGMHKHGALIRYEGAIHNHKELAAAINRKTPLDFKMLRRTLERNIKLYPQDEELKLCLRCLNFNTSLIQLCLFHVSQNEIKEDQKERLPVELVEALVQEKEEQAIIAFKKN